MKALGTDSDTLFLDGADDIIYWQADRFSQYPYVWYTSFMRQIPLYANARQSFLLNTPPTFYYRYCSKEEEPSMSLPEALKNQYVLFYSDGKPTCLYMMKTKLPLITSAQWEIARSFHFELPVTDPIYK